MKLCDVCWHSHGCWLPEGHKGNIHVCLDSGDGSLCTMITHTSRGWIRFDWDEHDERWVETARVDRVFHAVSDEEVP